MSLKSYGESLEIYIQLFYFELFSVEQQLDQRWDPNTVLSGRLVGSGLPQGFRTGSCHRVCASWRYVLRMFCLQTFRLNKYNRVFVCFASPAAPFNRFLAAAPAVEAATLTKLTDTQIRRWPRVRRSSRAHRGALPW